MDLTRDGRGGLGTLGDRGDGDVRAGLGQAIRGRGRGFTLIELLVVVSVIALLVGLLLPAVGTARRRARITACVQNMKQHGIGVQSYAAANGDELPNAPLAPPTDDNKYGYAGRTAMTWASLEFPVNGFAFSGRGVPTWAPFTFKLTPTNSLPNFSERFNNMTMYNGYWIVMSEYMTDGEGLQPMSDVFYCPSDTAGPKVRDNGTREYLLERDGRWPGLGTDAAKDNQRFRTCSYRYVGVAVLDPKTVSVDRSGNDLTDFQFDLTPLVDNSQQGLAKFYSYIRRNPQSSVDYPSGKVLFFMDDAYHNPDRGSWFEPQAISTVALADGSARETIAIKDALPSRPRENAGSSMILRYIGTDDPNTPDVDETVSYYAPYLHTWGGVRGRDL